MDDKKLKIFMTTDTVGGVWNYSLEFCRALYPYNLEVHLLALGATPDDDQVKEVNALKNVTLYSTNLKLEWMQDPWKDVDKTEKKIEVLSNIIQPDIFHFNNYINKTPKTDIPKITVYHSCVQTWWQAVKGCNAPVQWNDYLEHLKKSCNSSDVLVFPTDAIRKAAFQTHDFDCGYRVIPNARKMPASTHNEREKIILCTGRVWDEAKNLMILCELADQLPWPIYVAGDNTDPNTSEKFALKNVRFLGKLNSKELKYWLERTEIYINPALYEPFGLAVLEAAKAGCALALSNLETLREVWRENALYFNPHNKKEIVQTLLKLIENVKLRTDCQNRAKIQAEHYNVKKMGESYYQLYQSLLAEKQKSPIARALLNEKKVALLKNRQIFDTNADVNLNP